MGKVLVLAVLVALGLMQAANADRAPRILVMGDSFMASHRMSGRAVSHVIERVLHEPVTTRAVLGARMIYRLPISGALGMDIDQQYRRGNWDWVVLNGGGNDLWLGCGCHRCERKMDRLISKDGRKGAIPQLFARIRKDGGNVLYVGYLRSPGVDSPIEACKDEGDELEARIARLAKRWKGVHYLSNQDLVPNRDRSYHGLDMIHPSIKGSRAIGTRIARFIAKNRK